MIAVPDDCPQTVWPWTNRAYKLPGGMRLPDPQWVPAQLEERWSRDVVGKGGWFVRKWRFWRFLGAA
jgi:hypothetical protein